ncbi:MAG: biopolymer transporter ExbD [Saprospiraceae bacterium]|nr:biopolymer transporter ExbD [Saprospiraceae bacterium]
MPLVNRSKVTATFSMSALTDIIFLLLIFFMLTSSLVQIEPFDLPVSDSKTVANTDIVVSIDGDGKYKLNNKTITKDALEAALSTELSKAESQENLYVTVVSEVNNHFEETLEVLKMANRLKAKAILATQPRD